MKEVNKFSKFSKVGKFSRLGGGYGRRACELHGRFGRFGE
jgi:hypothetical protein